MDFYRKEISDFIRLSETLLSPTFLGAPLTNEERQVIEFYVRALSDIGRVTDTTRLKETAAVR